MIPFNKPYYSGNEIPLITKLMTNKVALLNNSIIQTCEALLENKYGFKKAFLTNSCTQALEMAAVLANINTGDEVIMPSYTFVSTANAFALRGAKIIFCDSQANHPNMDEALIEGLITSKTKAIVVVHYSGVACNMEAIQNLARKHNLLLIEDAAQAIDSFYNDKPLGTFGDIACFSFHETKNIHCGEGGFMVVNNPAFIERAEIVRHKGTNRTHFLNGEVAKYQWVDIGFSSIPSDITASFLYAQFGEIEKVQEKRLLLWECYYNLLQPLKKFNIGLPAIMPNCTNNAHIFYLICENFNQRQQIIEYLKANGVLAVFHYQSLHSSPYYRAKHDGRVLSNADKFSDNLLRLPMFYDLTLNEVTFISNLILAFFQTSNSTKEHVRD